MILIENLFKEDRDNSLDIREACNRVTILKLFNQILYSAHGKCD
jgi:hypothetical protein